MLFIDCSILRGNEDARNDVESARAAFATLRQYQKTDDIRVLDLLSRNCSITFTIIGPKIKRTVVVPSDVFRARVRKEIALKRGNNDSYEDVKFSTQGTKVSVTATVRTSRSGDTERFFAAYGRDDKRILKIQELKIAVFAPYSYTDAELREMFVKRVQPEYPYSARALRHVGHGTFRLAVNEQGRVSSVKTVKSTGYTELDRSCLVALGQWQAKPGTAIG